MSTLHKHFSRVSVFRSCIASHALCAALTMYHHVFLILFDILLLFCFSFFYVSGRLQEHFKDK